MNKFKGRHFSIRFNHIDMKYYLLDLGNGFGTFYKMEYKMILKDGYLINIGNSYIVSNITGEGIVLVIYNESTDKGRYVFKKDDGVILLGRDEDCCDVVIKDGLLSRVHCSVWWDENEGKWMMLDGKEEKEGEKEQEKEGVKSSTNGTWVYVIEEKEITEGMIFKSNYNLFMCKYCDK